MRGGAGVGIETQNKMKDVTWVSGLSKQQDSAIYRGGETEGQTVCCGESQVCFGLCLLR